MNKRDENLSAFTVRIPQELKFQIDLIAQKDGRSANNLIKIILQEYVDNVNKVKK